MTRQQLLLLHLLTFIQTGIPVTMDKSSLVSPDASMPTTTSQYGNPPSYSDEPEWAFLRGAHDAKSERQQLIDEDDDLASLFEDPDELAARRAAKQPLLHQSTSSLQTVNDDLASLFEDPDELAARKAAKNSLGQTKNPPSQIIDDEFASLFEDPDELAAMRAARDSENHRTAGTEPSSREMSGGTGTAFPRGAAEEEEEL